MAEKEFQVSSLFGADNRKGLVQLEFDGARLQIDPDEARGIARMIHEAAESAETDEFLWSTFTVEIGLDHEGATMMLHTFRQYRDARREERARNKQREEEVDRG